MLKIFTYFNRYILRKGDDPNILLLRILLLSITIAVLYLIFVPSKKNTLEGTATLLVNGEKQKEQIAFHMVTTHLCAAVTEAQIAIHEPSGIEVTFFKKQDGTRRFIPLSKPEKYTVENGDCIPAYPLCEGKQYEYCFTIDRQESLVKIDYSVEERTP